MICPNCGAQSPTDDCIKCGVIISKHIALEAKHHEGEEQPPQRKKMDIYVEEKPSATKAIVLNILFLITCLVVYIVACPFLTVNNLKKAVEQQDTAEMANYIDYDSLRESLKKQFDDKILQSKTKAGDPTASLAEAYVSKLTEPMLDEAVTPEGIFKMMTGYKQFKNKKVDPTLAEVGGGEQKALSGILMEARSNYDSLNEFSMVISTEKDNETRIVMKRYGIFSWKVGEIILGAE
ncbi:DUF2939 domain-containing protein [Desulforegula conservatrix]|uniref:DUF2939 domain-containing protein n=1 Tax=Desulforegula conservatrix TaxID=153026 RepID=UPI0003FC6ED6|nr:DUF2939 domain-containing protein [Desulforegula conservatrix]